MGEEQSFDEEQNGLCVLTVISSYYTRERVAMIASWHDTKAICLYLGRGTVKKTIQKSAGITDMRKGVVTILATRENAQGILQDLTTELQLNEPNTGIAFLGKAILPNIPEDKQAAISQSPGDTDEASGTRIKAVYVIVNRGFAEDVILEAEKSGIGGATVITAYEPSPAVSPAIPGLSQIREREIVLMVTTQAKAAAMFQGIQTNRDIMGKGRGIIFVTEVEETVGVHFY